MGLYIADLFRRSNMKGTMNEGTYSPDYSLASVDLKSFKNNLMDIIQQNKERWKELAAQGIVVYEVLLPFLYDELAFSPRFLFFFNKIGKTLLIFEI